MNFKKLLFLLLFALSYSAFAGPMDPIVSAAWVSETVPGQQTATLQLNITTIKAIKLLSVKTELAGSVQIHSVKPHKVRPVSAVVSSVALPEHRTIEFGSKNLFLMMTDIKKTLNAGDKFPVTLTYTFADKKLKTVEVMAEVRKTELSYKHYRTEGVYDHR